MNSELDSLPVFHLQLSKPAIVAIKKRGIHDVGAAIRFSEGPISQSFRYFDEIKSAIARLKSTFYEGQPNWVAYWKSCCDLPDKKFSYLCATCKELERLSESALLLPVTHKNFGNAGAMLARANITNIRVLRQRLLDGIEDVPGLGSKKIKEFLITLAEFVELIDEDGNVATNQSKNTRNDFVILGLNNKPLLIDSVSELPIGILRLGGKANVLINLDMETLGDVADRWPLSANHFDGLGNKSIAKIETNLAALQKASTGDGNINWQYFANAVGIDLIPAKYEMNSAADFLSKLPDTIVEIANCLKDPVLADILLNRLSKRSSESKTLEQIGLDAIPKITRERVRQKERKLLQQIAEGLIWDSYSDLDLLFHEDFACWWKRAAQFFEGSQDTTFEKFVAGLVEVWGADAADISNELPIILAIVTGEVHMSSGFRDSDQLNSKYLTNLPESTRQISVTKLRIGKTASQLKDSGYMTVGDICDGTVSGDIFVDCLLPGKRIVDHLNMVQEVIDHNSVVNWQLYKELVAPYTLPSSNRNTALDFARYLVSDLSEMINELQMPTRASEIFRLRTCQLAKNRMTLQGVAIELGTHQPAIKMEETRLLEVLNDVLIEQDFSRVPFWVDPDFLFFWEEAQAAYLLAEGSYSQFVEIIRDCWMLSEEDADSALPSLWSVINGYPNGRPTVKRRRKKRVRSIEILNSNSNGRIRLAGFSSYSLILEVPSYETYIV